MAAITIQYDHNTGSIRSLRTGKTYRTGQAFDAAELAPTFRRRQAASSRSQGKRVAPKPTAIIGTISGALPAYAWGGGEQILPGAYRRSLSDGRAINLLLEHDSACCVASTADGTLKLWEDDRGGLRWRAEIPDTQLGWRAMNGVSGGRYRGFSHGGSHQTLEAGRYIVEFGLLEVSLHPSPKFHDASVSYEYCSISKS